MPDIKKLAWMILMIGAIAITAATTTTASEAAQSIELKGCPNLHRVNDNYYRGAQPSEEGFRSLEKMGIKTVVNLRTSKSDRSRLKNTKLDYEHIWFKTWHPEEEDVVRFINIVTDPKRQPVFVHCRHGADRTGLMTALYRITVDGWSKQDAIKEMTTGGFGFHPEWKNLIKFIEKFDVEELRRQLDLEKTAKTP